MIDVVNIWSRAEQKETEWTVERRVEIDEAKNEHSVVVAYYKDEIHRFSPNVTEAELIRMVKQINEEKG